MRTTKKKNANTFAAHSRPLFKYTVYALNV